MRKRSLKYIFDRVYWHLLCLMPFILYAIFLLSYQISDTSIAVLTFSQFLDVQGLNFIVYDNVVYTTFIRIFGSTGILPVFPGGSPIIWYATYVTLLHLVRLCVEFVTFLPILCHRFYEKLMEM